MPRCAGCPTAGPHWACKPSPVKVPPRPWAKARLESSGRGSGEDWSQGWRTPQSGGLPGLTAVAGHAGADLPPPWPTFPLLWLLGIIVQAQQALPPCGGHAVPLGCLPHGTRNLGCQSLSCSHLCLHHDIGEASSLATTASVWITANCGKFLKKWEYHSILPVSCMQVRKQQLEQNMEQQTGSRLGGHQGCIVSPCLFNCYAEYIMGNARLDESHSGIKVAGRSIDNLR